MTSSQVYAPASVPSGSEDLHDCIPEGPTLSPRSGANVLRCCSRRRNGTSLIALGLQLWKSSKAPDGCTSPPPRASELSRCFRSECASRHLTVTWASAVEIRPAGSPSVSREPRSGWPPARCPGPADHRVRAAQRDIRATRASHSRPRSDHTALRAPCPNPSNLPAGWRGPSTTGSAPSTCAPFLSCVKPGGTEHDTIVDHLGAHVIRVPMPPRDDQLDLPLDRHAPRLVLSVSLRAFVAYVTVVAPDDGSVNPEPRWPGFDHLGFLPDHRAILVRLSVLTRTIFSWEYRYLPAQ